MRQTHNLAGIILLLAVISIISIAGCKEKEQTVITEQQISPLAQQAADEGVDFTTQTADYRNIAGTLYDTGAARTVILLHMLRADRHSWDGFIPLIINAGFNVVSIDQRGHGDSEGDLGKFSKAEFADMYLDARAAKEYAVKQGIKGRFILVGASIGANNALRYAVNDLEIQSIVLMSPGLDYRGATTKDILSQYAGNMMFVVSSDDVYSIGSSTELYTLAKVPDDKKTFRQYEGKAHGTDMFATTSVADDIIDWLKKQ